jgi:hypothetical protein
MEFSNPCAAGAFVLVYSVGFFFLPKRLPPTPNKADTPVAIVGIDIFPS